MSRIPKRWDLSVLNCYSDVCIYCVDESCNGKSVISRSGVMYFAEVYLEKLVLGDGRVSLCLTCHTESWLLLRSR